MRHFDYRDGVFHAEDIDLREIAREVGTPFYCYSRATLTRHYEVFSQAFAGMDAMVCFAMKANCAAPWRPACRANASPSRASARRRAR